MRAKDEGPGSGHLALKAEGPAYISISARTSRKWMPGNGHLPWEGRGEAFLGAAVVRGAVCWRRVLKAGSSSCPTCPLVSLRARPVVHCDD